MEHEQRDMFMDELYEKQDVDSEALALLRADMERRGLKWEEPDSA